MSQGRSQLSKPNFAHALKYKRESADPELLVSGEGTLAELIIAIAKNEGIPIEQSRELSELLARQKKGPVLSERAVQILAIVMGHCIQVDQDLASSSS